MVTEQEYFNQYVKESDVHTDSIKFKKKLSSKQWMVLWQECQLISEEKTAIGFWFKIKALFKYGVTDWSIYKQDISKIITTFQAMYYRAKQAELSAEIADIEKYSNSVNKNLLEDLCKQSMVVLKDKLARKYEGNSSRKTFSEDNLWKEPYNVLAEYPVILSTTFSSRNSLNSDVVYDYLIMDEASQVDIATGALALSCARNVVIVGDTKQLPNVVTDDIKAKAKAIFDRFNVSEGYQYTNSFLQSILDVMPNVTQTLLREHYRCHPKIINFCNQKFYRGELIIMTTDKGEEDVLSVVKTVAGNHERNNSKKEHKKILQQMHQVDKAESLILIATGSLVGEGFDFPRLDTLFMATPVSFRGVVEQYAGRLNRDYAGKENVIIYDYVDNHIPMFDNMYAKRLKAYKQIGYELACGLQIGKQTVNAIYDWDNYSTYYHKDLLGANNNIIISSPVISGPKVYELINLLKEKQMSGVQITIVTWAPDSYRFGDAAYWMQLHEDMRQAGFYIKTVEESCERFAVIDQEVVWYGNINLLAKDKVDDSIMRVMSKEIASELMEITFGDNG